MDVNVYLEGQEITEHVVDYASNWEICGAVGTIDITISDNSISIDPWDEIVLYENGQKRATYYVLSLTNNTPNGERVISCQDTSIKLINYFISQIYTVETRTTTDYWIDKFMDLAGVNVNFSSVGTGPDVSNYKSFGLQTAMEAVTELLRMSGWFMYFDSNGTAVIKELHKNPSNYSETLTSQAITQLVTEKNDEMLRNKAIVWGGTDLNGVRISAVMETTTPWNYDSKDDRAIVLSHNAIYTQDVANELAAKMIKEFARITYIKTVTIPADYNLYLGQTVLVKSQYYTGTALVTEINTTLNENGFVRNVTLDSRCPRLFSYFGILPPYPEEPMYVYIGTWGDGIKYKDVAGSTWYDFSTGLISPDIVDLAINQGVYVCIASDGYAYYRVEGDSQWTLINHGEFGAIGYEGLFDSAEVVPQACAIDVITNRVYIGYRGRDENVSWISELRVDTGQLISKSQLLPYDQYEIVLQDMDHNSKQFIFSAFVPGWFVLEIPNNRNVGPVYAPLDSGNSVVIAPFVDPLVGSSDLSSYTDNMVTFPTFPTSLGGNGSLVYRTNHFFSAYRENISYWNFNEIQHFPDGSSRVYSDSWYLPSYNPYVSAVNFAGGQVAIIRAPSDITEDDEDKRPCISYIMRYGAPVKIIQYIIYFKEDMSDIDEVINGGSATAGFDYESMGSRMINNVWAGWYRKGLEDRKYDIRVLYASAAGGCGSLQYYSDQSSEDEGETQEYIRGYFWGSVEGAGTSIYYGRIIRRGPDANNDGVISVYVDEFDTTSPSITTHFITSLGPAMLEGDAAFWYSDSTTGSFISPAYVDRESGTVWFLAVLQNFERRIDMNCVNTTCDGSGSSPGWVDCAFEILIQLKRVLFSMPDHEEKFKISESLSNQGYGNRIDGCVRSFSDNRDTDVLALKSSAIRSFYGSGSEVMFLENLGSKANIWTVEDGDLHKTNIDHLIAQIGWLNSSKNLDAFDNTIYDARTTHIYGYDASGGITKYYANVPACDSQILFADGYLINTDSLTRNKVIRFTKEAFEGMYISSVGKAKKIKTAYKTLTDLETEILTLEPTTIKVDASKLDPVLSHTGRHENLKEMEGVLVIERDFDSSITRAWNYDMNSYRGFRGAGVDERVFDMPPNQTVAVSGEFESDWDRYILAVSGKALGFTPITGKNVFKNILYTNKQLELSTTETNNFSYVPFFFIGGQDKDTEAKTFLQKGPYESYFTERKINLPTSRITVIRMDDDL